MLKNISKEIRELLDNYASSLSSMGNIVGVYVVSSIALDAFEKTSDVDLLVVLSEKFSIQALSSLEKFHSEFSKNEPLSRRLDVNFYPLEALSKKEKVSHAYYSNGTFTQIGFWDLNPVTLWILKNKGISLFGKSPAELDFQLASNDLRDTMHFNLNVYWKNKIEDEAFFNSSSNVFEGVSTICRIAYTLENGDIVSKLDAVKKHYDKTPLKLHILLNEVCNLRSNTRSIYKSMEQRKQHALEFMRNNIELLNKKYFV